MVMSAVGIKYAEKGDRDSRRVGGWGARDRDLGREFWGKTWRRWVLTYVSIQGEGIVGRRNSQGKVLRHPWGTARRWGNLGRVSKELTAGSWDGVRWGGAVRAFRDLEPCGNFLRKPLKNFEQRNDLISSNRQCKRLPPVHVIRRNCRGQR